MNNRTIVFLSICLMSFVHNACHAEVFIQRERVFSIGIPDDWKAYESGTNFSSQVSVRHNTRTAPYMTIQFTQSAEVEYQLGMEEIPVNEKTILQRIMLETDKYLVNESKAKKISQRQNNIGNILTYEADYVFPKGGDISYLKQVYFMHKGYKFNVSIWSSSKDEQNELYKIFRAIQIEQPENILSYSEPSVQEKDSFTGYGAEKQQPGDLTEGFRNIMWGMDVSELGDVMVHHSGTAWGDYYYIMNDDLTVLDVPVKFIRYHFHKGKFFEVSMTLKNDYYKTLSDVLKSNLTEKYGMPEEKLTGDGRYATAVSTWRKDDLLVVLTVFQELGNGYLGFTYGPIFKKAQKALKGRK